MEVSKEYFFTKLKENSGGEVDYCGMLDGCFVFHLYHKKDLEIRSGPPIYAICDPNDPNQVKISQSMDIAARLCRLGADPS